MDHKKSSNEHESTFDEQIISNLLGMSEAICFFAARSWAMMPICKSLSTGFVIVKLFECSIVLLLIKICKVQPPLSLGSQQKWKLLPLFRRSVNEISSPPPSPDCFCKINFADCWHSKAGKKKVSSFAISESSVTQTFLSIVAIGLPRVEGISMSGKGNVWGIKKFNIFRLMLMMSNSIRYSAFGHVYSARQKLRLIPKMGVECCEEQI